MKYAFSFLAVIGLAVIAGLGSQIPGMPYLFGVALPYLAFFIFLGGFPGTGRGNDRLVIY